MPLRYEDQVNLLKDIISNHQTDCCGSVSEYEQLERLIKSLMVNGDIDPNSRQILDQIYSYSQDGINASDVNAHIESNQDKLSQWVDEINQLS